MEGHAIHFTAPGRTALERFRVDEALLDGHLEGEAVASAVSPGTEIESTVTAQNPAQFPSRTGYALVFRVTNPGTTAFAAGELVFAMKNHTSVIRCSGNDVWRLPVGIDPAAATLARLAGVSWSTLTTTLARPPAKVVVTGLGIVGHLAAQVFNAAGYRVLGCDPVQERREKLERLGVATCSKLPLDDRNWRGQAELVVDCSGHEGAVLDACQFVRKGGEVVLVGVPWRRRTELHAFDVLNAVFRNYVHLRGGWEWEVPMDAVDFRRGSIRDNIGAALQWIATERIKTDGLFLRANPRDCEKVYKQLQAREGTHLTAVFDWSLLEKSA
jgi:threonine dehydrogenase-like Zn-dependent dehydrogenase